MTRPLILAAFLALMGGPALADPCEAIPDRGPLPPYLSNGRIFSGPVVYIADGDGLCVDVRPGVSDAMARPSGGMRFWVEVRLADFYAPELHAPGGAQAKRALERIAKGRTAVCVAGKRSYDRVVATCRINGVSLADHLRAVGVREGGNGWRGGR